MQTLGLFALLIGACVFIYPNLQAGLPLPWLSSTDARLLAGIFVVIAGFSFLFRRRS